MSYWQGKRVLITGGAGFIGSHLAEMLAAVGAQVTVTIKGPDSPTAFLSRIKDRITIAVADLLKYDAALRVTQRQDVVMDLAVHVGGIEYNIKNPVPIFRENIQMFMNTIEASRVNNVGRYLVTSSACVYPRYCAIPTPEEDGFKDMPEPANEGYGFAKRIEEFLGQKYAQQYGMAVAIARPYNIYGPRDDFDPTRSNVIPALIKKIFDADEGGEVEVWSDGKQSRAFLYVEDAARGLMDATEKYAHADVLNVGAEEETTVAELTRNLIELSGRKLTIRFDAAKPQGQPRRKCDNRKAAAKIGFKAEMPLRQGLQRTIAWYLEHARPPGVR